MTETVHTPKTGLDHLRATVSTEVADNAALIARLDTLHISTRYDDMLSLEIDRMLASIMSNSVQEGYAVAVVGRSGAGKSHTIKRRLDAHPAFKPFDDGYGNNLQICLRVRTPATCNTKSLGIEILKEAGYPLKRTTITEKEVWRLVGEQLKLRQIRIIYLDETQHVLKEKEQSGRTSTQDTIKALMQNLNWPIWLILSGIPSMLGLIEADDDRQMERRTRVLHIGDMDEDDIALIKLITTAVVKRVDYKLGFPLTDAFLRRLLHAGIKRQGMIIQLIKMSIECAIWDRKTKSDTIEDRHFAEGYQRLSNCSDSTNVFLVANWADIEREVDNDGKLTEATRRK
jgi:hypothetical protein